VRQTPATAPAPRPLQTHLELAALPSAVSCARGHVRSVAREWGLAHLADTAELLASELVTNAVRASGRLTTRGDREAVPVVRIWVASDQTSISLHVCDGNDEMPVRKDISLEAEGGRGLLLVETLAKDWGAYRQASGKVVWAVIGDSQDDP
jgi:anti-sigma regulatory factor (Ser/Thr protein kinase)